SRRGSWLLFLDGIPQSLVDLEDPGYLEFEYVRRLGHIIDLAFPAGEPLRVLHLGGGGMTLPRYVAATRPGSQQLVAESDVALADLVRRHLPMPGSRAGRIRVRAADAREVTESVPAASFDLVISDVYAGALTPPHLTTAECVLAAARALAPAGVYAVNVADGRPFTHARGQVATVRSVYPQACMIAEAGVLRGRRRGNLVLAGSRRELPCGELRRRAAADPFPARVVDGEELGRFAGRAAVVTDATAGSGETLGGGAGAQTAGTTRLTGPGTQSTNW
ncbi:MAG: fused MFS/spermidine synthase, partial [Streptosporangiaceae bacterium]|nr:fused MFS/spermidine synthase [Streptosporangiaceae bacterium]